MTMLAVIWLSVLSAGPAEGSAMSVSAACKAIARGENVEAAVARLRAAGKPGLWALNDNAKLATGVERGRLFEAIGSFGTPEAEWALIVELKGADAEGKAGAIRGLARMKSGKLFATIAKQAESSEPVVRDAVVDAIVSLGGGSEKQQRALLESASEHARETVMRVLLQVEGVERALVDEAIASSLRDSSAAVRLRGVALVKRVKDQARVFQLAEMARTDREDVALLAVETLAGLGGWNGGAELAGIASDPMSKEQVWAQAAIALRAGGRDGFQQLLDAIARTRDDLRKAELAKIALERVSGEELDQVIDLLDDPAASRAAVGRMLLVRAGEPGREAATRRLSSALPELRAAIEACLAEAGGEKKLATGIAERQR